MANKNTKRLRRSMEKSRKIGVAIQSSNGGRWKGESVPDHEKEILRIRKITERLYFTNR